MVLLKSGVLYFVMVFGTGFILGIIRTIWVVPRLGARIAELIEMPFMFVVTIVSAKLIVQHYSIPYTYINRLGMGGIGLVLSLIAEFTMVLKLQNISLKEYFINKDSVTGTMFYIMLLLFAIMPILISRAN